MSKIVKNILIGSTIGVIILTGIIGINNYRKDIEELNTTIGNLQQEISAKDKQIEMWKEKLGDMSDRYKQATDLNNTSWEYDAKLWGISEDELFMQGKTHPCIGSEGCKAHPNGECVK